MAAAEIGLINSVINEIFIHHEAHLVMLSKWPYIFYLTRINSQIVI